MAKITILRNRPRRAEEAPSGAPVAQRRRGDSGSVTQCGDVVSTTRCTRPPAKLAQPLPELRAVNHVPWYWHTDTLQTDPPLRIARLSARSHGVKALGAKPTDGLFEAISVAEWERGVSPQGLRQLALQRIVRHRQELVDADGANEGESARTLHDFEAGLVQGGFGGEVAMWALERALDVSIVILRPDTSLPKDGQTYDVVQCRPLEFALSRSLANPEKASWIGLWEAEHRGQREWYLILGVGEELRSKSTSEQ